MIEMWQSEDDLERLVKEWNEQLNEWHAGIAYFKAASVASSTAGFHPVKEGYDAFSRAMIAGGDICRSCNIGHYAL
jgi:hypothetical protein